MRCQHVEEYVDARDGHDVRVREGGDHLVSDPIISGPPIPFKLSLGIVRVDEVLGDSTGFHNDPAGRRSQRGEFIERVDRFQGTGGAVLIFAGLLAAVRD